jgi:hypothetical protein
MYVRNTTCIVIQKVENIVYTLLKLLRAAASLTRTSQYTSCQAVALNAEFMRGPMEPSCCFVLCKLFFASS